MKPKFTFKVESDFSVREILIEILEIVALIISIGLFYWALP